MKTPPPGLWLPLITPFKDGAVDHASYDRLLDHYLALGVDALFPLGTTGESPTLDDAEFEQVGDAGFVGDAPGADGQEMVGE